jgi:signal transduction histidine kinase
VANVTFVMERIAEHLQATIPGGAATVTLTRPGGRAKTVTHGFSAPLSKATLESLQQGGSLTNAVEVVNVDQELQGLPYRVATTVKIPLPSIDPAWILLFSPEPLAPDQGLQTLWMRMAERAGTCLTHALAWARLQEQESRDRELAAEQRRIAELRTRFVSHASHEFRTPLAIIRAAVGSLVRYYDRMSPEDRMARLTKIDGAVEGMTRLLDDVMSFGRVDTASVSGDTQPTDLVRLCRETLADCSAGATNAHELTLDCKTDALIASIDPTIIRQILGNLVGNAIKYSPSGGRVEIELSQVDDNVVLRVSDEGLGIPAQEQTRVFEPFQRGSSVSDIPGTGLGLAITQAAIERLKGSITLISQEGIGSSFCVTLPAVLGGNTQSVGAEPERVSS